MYLMKNILKKIAQYVVLAIPFTSFIVATNMFFPFITGKAFFFRTAVEIALGLTLALMVYDPSVRPKKSILLWCFVAFTAIIFVADIFSLDPARALWSNFERMEGFVTLAHLFAYFLVLITLFREKKDWNMFFYVSVTASYFLMLYGLLQFYREIAINQSSDRVDGTLGNAAYYAIYLVFQIFIFALLWWRSRGSYKGIANAAAAGLLTFVGYYLWHVSDPFIPSGSHGITLSILSFAIAVFLLVYQRSSNEKAKQKIAHVLFGAGIFLNAFLLYFTETRGAILGFIGGLILASLYILFTHRENKIVRKGAIITLSVIALIVIGFLSVKNLPAVKNDPVLGRFASISWNETKDQARSYVWPMAFKGIAEKPILGWGQEGFMYIFDKYYNPAMWGQEPWFDRAHNSFIDWTVAGGILGGLAYISLFVAALYLIFKKKDFDVFEKAILFGLLGAYAFNNIFVFDNLVSYIFFFAILAMVGGESLERDPVREKRDQESPHMLAAIILVLTVVLIYVVNANPFLQNITLLQALSVAGVQDGNIVSCASASYQRDYATGNYKQICNSWYPTSDLFLKALSYNSFGNSEVREHFTDVSTQVNAQSTISNDIKSKFAQAVIAQFDGQANETPHQSRPFLYMGSYLTSIGMPDQALSYLAKANSLSPQKQQILFAIGQAYIAKDDVVKANEYFKQAYDEAPTYPDAEAFYAISSLAVRDNTTANKIIADLVSQDIADARIASTLISAGRKSDAIDYVNRVLAKDPQNANAKNLLSQITGTTTQ